MMRAKIGYLYTMIEVQFTRTSVIIKTIRDVGILLNLSDGGACTDGVSRSNRHEDGIAGFDATPVEKRFDLARACRFFHALRRDGLLETNRHFGIGFGCYDVPGFSLA